MLFLIYSPVWLLNVIIADNLLKQYCTFCFLTRWEVSGPRLPCSQTAVSVHRGRSCLGGEVSNKQTCSNGRCEWRFVLLIERWTLRMQIANIALIFNILKYLVSNLCGNNILHSYTNFSVFRLLLCVAAPWRGPGGESLPPAGRGVASAENVGRSQARYSQHQLHGHSVRTPRKR